MKPARLCVGLAARWRVDTDDPRRLVAQDLVAVCRARWGDDHVARPGVEALVFDRPAHSAGADDDYVILRGIVRVRPLDLAHRMRHEVHLDVVEPDAFVFAVRPGEAAVVGLVGDLDHRSPFLMFQPPSRATTTASIAGPDVRQMRRNLAPYVQFVSSRRTVCRAPSGPGGGS